MADYPNAAENIASLIRTYLPLQRSTGARMPLFGHDIEGCAEAAVASMFIEHTALAENVTLISVRTWKVIGARWDMHDSDLVGTVIDSGNSTPISLKGIVRMPNRNKRWQAELSQRSHNGYSVHSFGGRVVNDQNRFQFIVENPLREYEPQRRNPLINNEDGVAV